MPKATFFNLPEEKRRRIIDLALEEFARSPYSKASLSGIVARAGIAKGSMYQYFEDKRDLYLYLLEMAAREKIAYLQNQEIDFQGNFFAALEQIALAGVRFNLEHPRLSMVMAKAMGSTGEEVLQEFMGRGKGMAVDYFEKMLVQAQEKGQVRRDLSPRLMANLVHGVLGTGLADYLLETMGVTMGEFLADPGLAQQITEDRVRFLIRDVILLLRKGLEG